MVPGLLATPAFTLLIRERQTGRLHNIFNISGLFAEVSGARPCGPRTRVCRFVVGVAVLFAAGLVPAPAAAQPGAPSGWTVADFNADGRPDLAVADRAAGPDGSNYRIDVRLSNGLHQSVSFVSALRALTVRAIDIDNDHDVDLVVMPPLGHDVVAVWLNDGAGHFRESAPGAAPPQPAAISTAGLRSGVPQLAVATPTPRRAFDALPLKARPPTDSDATGALASASARFPRSLFASQRPARAPPSHV